MRFGFLIKAIVATALVMALDCLLSGDGAGTAIGVFAGLWMVGVTIAHVDGRRGRRPARACARLGSSPALVRPAPKESWRTCDGRVITLSVTPRP